jgi:hypothetical protein
MMRNRARSAHEQAAINEIWGRSAFAYHVYTDVRKRCDCGSFFDALHCELFKRDVAAALRERAEADRDQDDAE